MGTSLLQSFRDLDRDTKDALADLESPLLRVFAALSIAHQQCSVERLSSEHIMACLEAAGVAATKKTISSALARAGDRVSTSKGLDGETLYRLMTAGEREIAPYLGGGGLIVVRFDSNAPRTARLRLGEALSSLRGVVRISDPYYGVRSLDSLDHIPLSCQIRFLTKTTSEPPRKVKGAFRDFVSERPSTEFRIVGTSAKLHDRYVLASSELLLVGHGLKDIGGKESFMVSIAKKLGEGIISQTRAAFDAYWRAATPLLP